MIHYTVSGSGTDWLVFVHGLTCDGSDWKNQIAAFESKFRCLTVDLRGHGQSVNMTGPYDTETLAADVIAVLRELKIERVVMIAHSMGTRVIAAAHIQAPEEVAGLVFVDGSQQGEGDPVLLKQSTLERFSDPDAGRTILKNMFTAMFTDRSNPTERDSIIKRALDLPIEQIAELISNMRAWDAGRMRVAYQQIKIPFAVVQSTTVDSEQNRRCLNKDEISPYLSMLQEVMPQAAITVVPDTGHFTQLDAPEDVNAVISNTAAQVFI